VHEIPRLRKARDYPGGQESWLPVRRRSLEKLGLPRAIFYRWYDRYSSGRPEVLNDCSRPDRVWNRIPDPMRERIIQLALDEPMLSPRQLAVRFTDRERPINCVRRAVIHQV
jgi:putative transposase